MFWNPSVARLWEVARLKVSRTMLSSRPWGAVDSQRRQCRFANSCAVEVLVYSHMCLDTTNRKNLVLLPEKLTTTIAIIMTVLKQRLV